jgi:signal transduction histidine kinase
MKRALVTSVSACIVGAVALALGARLHTAVVTFGLLLGVSAAALLAAAQARRMRAWIGPLRRQLAVAVGIAVGAILAAVWVAAYVMFISGEDALLVSVMAAVIAVAGLSIARLLTEPVVGDIERLRERLRAVGAGDRSGEVAAGGNDELAELAIAANTMIEQLREEEAGREAAEDARRRLVIAASHDLRTPLAALRVLTEAIEDGIATGATRARYLREMRTHVAVLTSLIDDLFELSRAQAGEPALNREPVEIGELVSETVAAMRAAGDNCGVSLRAEPQAGRAAGAVLTARASPEQIRRVLLNLLDNAIRHTPSGGSVVARTARRDGRVEVEVADDGRGIAGDEREHVFEAFFRGGGNGARAGRGAGLGLAIAREIVSAHGGEIWLAPAQRGTRVCFSLPAAEQPAGLARPASLGEVTPAFIGA